MQLCLYCSLAAIDCQNISREGNDIEEGMLDRCNDRQILQKTITLTFWSVSQSKQSFISWCCLFWCRILVPEYGCIQLELIPMLVGFFTYKIATLVQAIEESLTVDGKSG